MTDLSNLSVFIDFDGTISATGVGVHLLTRLGRPEWRAIDDRFIAGEIGSRECMSGQWRCLPTTDEATLRAVAAEVPLDEGFDGLLRWLEAGGAEVAVVSDGFGFYVEDALERYGVDIISNRVDFATGELTFPNGDPACPCQLCGTCKPAPIRAARARGRTTVFIGDGVSDRKAAAEADVVYAKARLASWCTANDVPFVAYTGLDDVRRHLVGDAG